MTRDQLGSYPAATDGPAEDGVVSPAETPEAPVVAEPRRKSPAVRAAAIIAIALVAAVAGGVLYVRATAPIPTPSIVSLTPTAADAVLRSVRLKAGKATYEVTKGFPAGRIIAQFPSAYAHLTPGSSVNVRVAVAPKPSLVPDVVGAESGDAQSVLKYALFKPTVLFAYSKGVRSGQVIEQLPRAGDTALTGSADVIVVSLGPGKPGAQVPAMIGKTFAQASTEASNATLFVQPRPVIATGTPDGTIVDQAPAAGTTVPVASNVWVSIADSRASR
jgi:eukaryotic-like serine/threonine-protein kinase